MVNVIPCVCSVFAAILHATSAQWGFMSRGWGQPDMGMLRASAPGGQWGRSSLPVRRNRDQYQTCIGKNSNGDEMRVTFSMGESSSEVNNPWMRRWGASRGRRTHRLNAVVNAGQASTLQGHFRFVITEGSRTEEVCSMQALGRILTDETMWGPDPTPHGIVGNTITMMPGQTATSTEILDAISFQELPGRGLALCPAHLVSGSECRGIIPLCCKIGWDLQPALEPFMQQGMMRNGMMGGGLMGQNMMGGGMMSRNMMGGGLMGQNMMGMSNTGGQVMNSNLQGGATSGLIANTVGMQNTGGLAF